MADQNPSEERITPVHMKLEPGLEFDEAWCEVKHEPLGQNNVDPLADHVKLEPLAEDNLESYSVQVKLEPEQYNEDAHSVEVKSEVTMDYEVPLSVHASETVDQNSNDLLNIPAVTEEFDENNEESSSEEEASEVTTSDVNVGVSSSSDDLPNPRPSHASDIECIKLLDWLDTIDQLDEITDSNTLLDIIVSGHSRKGPPLFELHQKWLATRRKVHKEQLQKLTREQHKQIQRRRKLELQLKREQLKESSKSS